MSQQSLSAPMFLNNLGEKKHHSNLVISVNSSQHATFWHINAPNLIQSQNVFSQPLPSLFPHAIITSSNSFICQQSRCSSVDSLAEIITLQRYNVMIFNKKISEAPTTNEEK